MGQTFPDRARLASPEWTSFLEEFTELTAFKIENMLSFTVSKRLDEIHQVLLKKLAQSWFSSSLSPSHMNPHAMRDSSFSASFKFNYF